jgi:WD40 repeat protein
MKQHALFKVYVVVSFSYFVSGLEHEKSFLVQDSFGSVACLAAYNDSVYIANSNDVVQRDAETGDVQRTFRAHQNSIVSFIITEDSRMITSAYDDLIIIWNLHTGSILKRIFVGVSNTQIQSISYQNGKIIMGGADRKVRQLDLVTGRVLRTFGKRNALNAR